MYLNKMFTYTLEQHNIIREFKSLNILLLIFFFFKKNIFNYYFCSIIYYTYIKKKIKRRPSNIQVMRNICNSIIVTG